MSVFQALKSACKASTVFKNFDNIEIGAYNVVEFKFMVTRYGQKVVVVTEDFMCFLPDRIAKAIKSDEAIAELNSVPYIMKYNGKDTSRHNLVMLDFERAPQQNVLGMNWDVDVDPYLQPGGELNDLSEMGELLGGNLNQQ